ncbi:MAG TPA: phospholipid carrier-dependent glycosyltransferase, partial [Pyrinomonadaceae bacterium]|nr:phospholipid carrier-dependent glycosyltransferase [Pyrinomonadaceae bacterium]
MEAEAEPQSAAATVSRFSLKRHAIVFAVLLAIIGAAILRSNITTGLDSFTYDEAYHIGSGAAYVQTGDFRLNPEQPPLTKLWVGAYVTWFGYQASPFRSFADKEDERDFVEQDAYFNNDPFALQTRARTAMFALNGLLLLFFSLAVWRAFGEKVAVAAALFLAIDPTVAAHMPVAMTDLPIALTSGIAILTAATAFRSWRPFDLIIAAFALGLALSAKHSGIITLIAVAAIGMFLALIWVKGAGIAARFRHAAAVAAVVLGGIVVLWAFYGFRYNESPGI